MNREKIWKYLSAQCVSVYWVGLTVVVWLVHFYDSQIFRRALIDHDDTIFIEPLSRLNLHSYFFNWLPDRSHYAFPLRDLTFLVDFKLSAALGVQTYWISNFVYFALGLYFVGKAFELLFPHQKLLLFFLMAIVALHPVNVEMLQWASMRKHLLAALILNFGFLHVLRLYLDQRCEVSHQTTFWVAGLTILSLLCWPTAIIWPIAVMWLLRKKLLHQNAPIFALVTGAAVFGAVAFRLISATNTDYARHQTTLFTISGITMAWQWVWRSLGRATFNLLIPIREVAYYDVDSIFNRIGFILLLALAAWFVWLSLKARGRADDPDATHKTQVGRDLFVYGGLLLLPQVFVVFTNSGFSWADHYLFTSFPYFVAAVGCFSSVGLKRSFKRARFASLLTACLLVLASYVACSLMQVPGWKDAISLLKYCATEEGTPLCITLMIEKNYDAGGCSRAFPYFESARKVYEARRNLHTLKFDSPFEIEMPMMESLCTATASNLGQPQKLKLIAEQERFYLKPTSFLFARVLSFLEAKDFASAWKLARATYLDPTYTIDAPNEKILTLLGGQAQALCVLSEKFKVHPECPELLKQYRARTNEYIFDAAGKADVQTSWSMQMSMRSFLNEH